MSTKQLNKNFRSISEEEQREINGGKVSIKQKLRDVVDIVDLMKKVEIERKFDELVSAFINLGRDFIVDRRIVNQD